MSVVFSKQIIDYPQPFIRASDLPVGSLVTITVDDAPLEFRVVNQGNPDSSLYDSSCEGTWLQMEKLYNKKAIGSSTNYRLFQDTSMYMYLNGEFFYSLDEDTQESIKTIKLPYVVVESTPVNEYDNVTSITAHTVTKEQGFTTRSFLLSTSEIGAVDNVNNVHYLYPTSVCLDYYDTPLNNGTSDASDLRCAELVTGEATDGADRYWTRSFVLYKNSSISTSYTLIMASAGSTNSALTQYAYWTRPAFVVHYDTRFNSETKELIGRPIHENIDSVYYVGCIRSTGSQYIDTGFKPNQNTRIVIKAARTGTFYNGSNFAFYGAGGSDGGIFALFNKSASTTLYTYYWGENQAVTGIDPTIVRVYDKDKNKFLVDGTLKHTHTFDDFQSDQNLVLFAYNGKGSIQTKISMDLYYCQIYDNEVLVRDLWPCLDKNAVACLYDKIEGKYYYDVSGTGTAFNYML